MQEPIEFVTVTVRTEEYNGRIEEYPVTINLNHIKIINGNYISLTDNLGYELTERSASSLRNIIDIVCRTHDCRR